MEEFHLYKDIKARTGGEIFLGVSRTCPYRKVYLCPALYGASGAAEPERQ